MVPKILSTFFEERLAFTSIESIGAKDPINNPKILNMKFEFKTVFDICIDFSANIFILIFKK